MSSASPEYLKTHEIVRAGAGAGKTYALTHKVADLAVDHEKKHGRLPRVIVTTFTRKATGELRERLMILALDENPHLIDFVNSRSHLVVSTIHGVMDLYLKRYGANLCIDPGYKIIGAPEALKIARQVMRQIVLGDLKTIELLEAYPFNRLVSLVRKLDALHSENPGAKPFTANDFETLFKTRGAEVAARLEDAATKILSETDKDTWKDMAECYTGLAALLKRGKWSVNRPFFLSARETMKVARKPSRGTPPVSESTMELAKLAREEADEFLEPIYDPDAWQVFAKNYETFEEIGARFHGEFRRLKVDQGLLEISDLEHLAMSCIRKHPETAEAFWREWDYWLIDEYQDTSPFQVELLHHLTGESPNFVVGDPQQSIYLFRGARSEVFGARESLITGGGGSHRLLTVNRRSEPELLLFFNDFFSAFDPPFDEMAPFYKDGRVLDPSRKVASVFIGERADLNDDTDGDETPTEKSDQEMRAIVAHVDRLLKSGTRPEDICVLARTNAVLTQVASHLSDAHFPTHVHAASGFYDRRETRDALAFLKFLVNPHDNFNTVEVLRSPWFKVPDRTLVSYARKRPQSLWAAIGENFSLTNDLRAILRLQTLLQMTKTDGLSEVFKKGLIEAGFIDLSHTHDVSGRRESNIWKLIARLQQEECKPGFNPLAFVTSSRVDIKLEEGNAEGDAVAAVEPDRINLMTVHASKGLEFKHVIVPRMEQRARLTSFEDFTYDERSGKWAMRVPFGEDYQMTGSLPEAHWLSSFQKQELDEHARVLYVALTRAIESVFLSWTGKPEKNSWAGMVRLDLEPGLHRGKNYSYEVLSGDPGEIVSTQFDETNVQPRPPYALVNEKHRGSARSVTELLEQSAGVHFVSGSDKQVTQLLQSASRGSAVHRLMELLKYPSAEMLERLVTKWFPGIETRVFEAIEFVRQSTNPPLVEIIANGEVEWGFAIKHGSRTLEGQLDLWGRTNRGEVWIVDYKTGTPENRRKAFDQMALYAFALKKSGLVGATESIQLAAVYPFSKQIFIESEPPAAKIESMLGA